MGLQGVPWSSLTMLRSRTLSLIHLHFDLCGAHSGSRATERETQREGRRGENLKEVERGNLKMKD